MKHRKWKFAFVVQMFAVLSACTVSNPVAAVTTDARLLFEPPLTDRQTLQQLMSRPETYPSLSALLNAPSSQGAWLVSLKPALVEAASSELAVKLPGEGVVRFKLKRSSDVAGMSGWLGDVASDRKQLYTSPDEVDFDPFNWVSLVRDGDQVVGDIHVKGQRFRLEPIGAGQHVLIKVDESRMPPVGEPILPPGPKPFVGAGKSAHSTIRVMFVTTKERRTRSPQYRAELLQALQNANQYLINSRVPLTYEFAGVFDPDYSEGAKSQWAMLNDMSNVSSALGSQVNIKREVARADLVSLYNTESSICGNAYGWSKKETGFNTISCTVALAHELGHNLGGGHGLEGTDPTKGYNHGYRHYSPNFHTIQVTSHGAVPYFSNPRLQYEGVAMGTVQNHDVARQFDEYRETVENFYPPYRDPVKVQFLANGLLKCEFIIPRNATYEVVSEATTCPAGTEARITAVNLYDVRDGMKFTLRSSGGGWQSFQAKKDIERVSIFKFDGEVSEYKNFVMEKGGEPISGKIISFTSE